MERRAYGDSGLEVTPLGFGAMQAGDPELAEVDAAALLHGVLDLGIRLIDTARSYGLSEERIGRHLAARRDQFVLSTKVGYGVPGVADWTPECIERGVEAARTRLCSDVLDIVHLHSCDEARLREGGVLEALDRCRARGWIRVAAYSGDAAPLRLAAASGLVGGLQASFNLCDQQAAATLVKARGLGIGTLAKRPFAGLPWRARWAPADPPHAEYWRRFQKLEPVLGARDWPRFALRFAAHARGVDCVLVGGTRLSHVAANVEAVAAGPLAEADAALARTAFREFGAAWDGIV